MGTAELAIVTTGIVGLGAPVLSAYFQGSRDRSLAARERREKDRDELRSLLDECAALLHERTEGLVNLEIWMQRSTLGLSKAKRAPRVERKKRALLATLEARLVIRRGREDVLVTSLQRYLQLTDGAMLEIHELWTNQQPFDYPDDQLALRADRYRAAFNAFVDASKEVVSA